MSIYDLPPRRQHGRRRPVVGLVATGLVLLVILLVATMLGVLPLPWATAADAPADRRTAGYLVEPPAKRVRAGCVDGSGSSGADFAPAVFRAVADGVTGWAGPETGDGAVPARPGLHLVLRTVSTDSSATEGQILLDREIPAVPGLAPPPAFDDPDYAKRKLARNKAAATRATAWRTAQAAATQVATEVRALQAPRQTTSAISACFAAAADSTPAENRRLLLASDLIENERPAAGEYDGSPALLVVSCPVGETTGCPARVTAWKDRLATEGAGAVHDVRADAAASEIAEWMESS